MDELDPFFQMGFAPAKKTSATSSQISSSQISSSQIPLNAMMTPQPMYHNYNNQQPNLYPAGPLSTLRSSPITNNWDFPTYQPPQQAAPSAAPQSNPYHDAKYQLAGVLTDAYSCE